MSFHNHMHMQLLLFYAVQLNTKMYYLYTTFVSDCGPGSVVGIATGYGLDGPRIESRWRWDFRTCPCRPWGPPSLLYNGYRVFPGGKEQPGRDADPSPLLVPWSWKGRAIPLLPLRAVRPVQSLSACSRVHFAFFFNLTPCYPHSLSWTEVYI